MSCQLPADCLNEIFEYLEEDKVTLYSCLLVNRLWCEISVRILWKDVWKYTVYWEYQSDVSSQILSTLVSCLSNESKELFYKNGIFITTPTSNPPLFNYASFCKVISIYDIVRIIDDARNEKNHNGLIAQEIVKMFMKQISSLKKLTNIYDRNSSNNINFINFPGTKDCLTNLSELSCSTNIPTKLLHQLSQICHDIQSLIITFESNCLNGLKGLISSQNNLKHLTLIRPRNITQWKIIIPLLTKHSTTLIRLIIKGGNHFKELQHVDFTRLQTLKFSNGLPKVETLIKFLENNGRNLKELGIGNNSNSNAFSTINLSNSLNLAIAEYCPNLRSLSTRFMNDETETLKVIFNSCQRLESIKVWCGGKFSDEKIFLEVLAKYSPKSFYKLSLFNQDPKLEPEDLEEFIISWRNRVPRKTLLFAVDKIEKENIEMIEKYKKE